MLPYLPQEIIRAKRDGNELAAEEIEFFVQGMTRGGIAEGQVAALAMAVFLRGMTRAETVALTLAMRDSGQVLDWQGLPGPVVDKHSTGGVGDKVSLILAPVLAACGAFVPMLSGRGLGHTGGTLDKLESIPGYTTRPDLERLRQVVRTAGCAIIGQTDDLAPADQRLYAIRDVTATVESIPLITASILAKKLAGGLQALVMDVKTGSGAFMPTHEQAETLAQSIVGVARGAGLPATALLSEMGQCLGHSAGNALEVAESLAMLRGEVTDARLQELVIELCAEALTLGGLAADLTAGRESAAAALTSGRAAERFAAMVKGLGGPGDLLERHRQHLPQAPLRREVFPSEAGHVHAVDARALGLAVVTLGGGRHHADHPVDHAVGLTQVRGVGAAVGADAPLAIVHGRDAESVAAAAKRVREAYILRAAGTVPPPIVHGRIG
ncbi:MAG: thymidine phosphorylase [Geminicoccaceae bacterium]